ncbi:hypothetical protein [Phaeocystidibacter marisrubri]|uniref:T9SS type A sorting domain-containing protein n=1 Tax=Phaeocystidibacter marisrubri TaxID=1577780 RepID=A0A6L3ZG28_9FLAO|nr:hypothetical protein [Phaeocystidibacter marisrubri]KAB2816412.1 hypothetical protein F8C82_12075 [Phaeocystidibacter marisrubri]GGH68930.1 hypothetical protein GCM10011318_09430 [Phaeocystidibacter marisrubri]
MKKFFVLIFSLAFGVSALAKVNPGEIIILGFESSQSIDEVWFLALAPIDAGEVVYMTDHGISATAPFTLDTDAKDSWLSFTVGANGLNVGDTWVINGLTSKSGVPTLVAARSSVTTAEVTNIQWGGAFTLSFGQGGDDLILYQGTSTQASRFVYGIGADGLGGSSVSVFEPTTAANLTRISNWGLTSGLTANFFDNGNSNYKFLGPDPSLINFNGTIDDILVDLGNPANYLFDVNYTLNDISASGDLRLGSIVPQPSNRYYNPADGNWYTDPAFTTLAIDPNRTHTVVVVTTSYALASGDTLDIAGIVVGDGSTPTTVTAGAGSVIQTVYGIQVTNAGVFEMNGTASVYLGGDFDVDAGGIANIQAGAHLDFEGNLIVDGTMTLAADATGFSTLGLHGDGDQLIQGTGTINAQMHFANAGWHHLSAPGSITFDKVSFNNSMALEFTGANRNIYRWDASRSGWFYTKATSDFGDSAFTVYMPASVIPTTINLAYVADDMDADVVNGDNDYTVRYHVPTSVPVNAAVGWASGNPADNAGWNMVKNPFWGHISWETIDDNLPAGLDNAVYYWNPASGAYDSWSNGTATNKYDIIPLLSYFAKAGNAAASANFTRGKSSVFDGASNNVFSKVANVKPQMILTATTASQSTDTHILFDDNASSNFDGEFDAYFRGVNPDRISFCSVSADSTALSINQLAFPNPTEDIYLTFDFATDGESATISLDNSYLPNGIDAYLEDTETGMIVDLNTTSYTFTNDINAPKQRFILHMTNNAVSLIEYANEEPLDAFRNNGQLVLKGSELNGSHHVEIMDMTGRVVVSDHVQFSAGEGRLTAPVNGPLVVRVWADNRALVVKTF